MESVQRFPSGASGKLSDDLTTLEGQKDQLAGKIQERYGVAKAEAEEQAGALGDVRTPNGTLLEQKQFRDRPVARSAGTGRADCSPTRIIYL